jgi:hypothetical protein
VVDLRARAIKRLPNLAEDVVGHRHPLDRGLQAPMKVGGPVANLDHGRRHAAILFSSL